MNLAILKQACRAIECTSLFQFRRFKSPNNLIKEGLKSLSIVFFVWNADNFIQIVYATLCDFA